MATTCKNNKESWGWSLRQIISIFVFFWALYIVNAHLPNANGVIARAAQNDWKIDSFDSQLTIQAGGQVKVDENIAVDFGNQSKHGLIRTIPYVYQNNQGDKTYTKIEVNNVTQDGSTVDHTNSYDGQSLNLKIGDAHKTISGKHTYQISYLATGILRSFASYDELYWNVTGNLWDVSIDQASATVILPSGEVKQASCYEGLMGATENCQTTSVNPTTTKFMTTRALTAGEGLTVAVGYPQNLVPILTVSAQDVPSPRSLLDLLISASTWITAGIVLLAGLIYLLYQWWQRGRDIGSTAGVSETIAPEFAVPDNIRPAEMGVLMDERADTLDVTATIVDLAVRGYLTIKEEPKKWVFGSSDYELNQAKKDQTGLLDYEVSLLNHLFASGSEIKLSEMKQHFYDDLRKIKIALYNDVTIKNYFSGNPEKIRTKWTLIAIGVMIVGGALGWGGVAINNPLIFGIGLGIISTGLITLAFSLAMPRRTALGHQLYLKSQGYKMFLSATEKYRQPFFEQEGYFMSILPYAIIFGVTDKLAKAFNQMGIEPTAPGWYTGPHPFNAIVFASSMNSFSHSISSAMASTPGGSGSGGGGFSGGGFGGGGGGSW